jgi:hypothetical protein
MATKIVQGTTEYAETISSLLTKYFNEANHKMGITLYIPNNYDAIYKNVHQRLSNPNSPFKYIILIDESNNMLGFINILFKKDFGEILLMLLAEGNNNQEDANQLVEYAVSKFKEGGINKIVTEYFDFDTLFVNALQNYKPKDIKRTVFIEN